jgi:excisionase family DNA binding protein
LTEEERDAADPWLTLAEIAEELRVNPATVRQWVTKGQLNASRAGVRKWIVRRSELDRMLAATSAADNAPAPLPEDASVSAEDRAATRPPASDAQSAIALLQIANNSFGDAIEASAFVPPAPGFIGRVRRIADSCEHVASTMLNAARLAGVRWSPRTDFGHEVFPYEVRAGGNRPGNADLWRDVDAALDRLVIAVTGTDVSAVAQSFRELGEELLAAADELEQDDSWQAGSRVG